MILLSLEMLAIQLNLVAQSIALGLDPLIVGLLLKFLGVVEILLAYGHQLLEFGR